MSSPFDFRPRRGAPFVAALAAAAAVAAAGPAVAADTLWAHDGFDYAVSGAPNALDGLDGGSGWAGGWRQTDGLTSLVAGLSYSDANGRTLASSGNAVSGGGWNGIASRYTQLDFGDGISTVWVSLLQRNVPVIADGELATFTLAGGGAEVGASGFAGIGRAASGSLRSVVGQAHASFRVSGSGSIAPSQTVLHVVRYDFADGVADTISLWRNPLLGEPLGAPTVSAKMGMPTLLTGATLGWLTNDVDSRFVFDELRIGSSFAAVTPIATAVPEPATTGLFAAGLATVGLLTRRRRVPAA